MWERVRLVGLYYKNISRCTVRWMSNWRSHCEVKMCGNLIVSAAEPAESPVSGRNLESNFTFQLISLYRSADGQLSFYPLGKEFPSGVSPFFLTVWEEGKTGIPSELRLEQAGSTFDVERVTAVKFGLHVGNIKFNTHTHIHIHTHSHNTHTHTHAHTENCIIYI